MRSVKPSMTCAWPVNPGAEFNHPEHPYPAEHAIKIAQFALEVTQNAQAVSRAARVALLRL